jgi:hypothetical protein
LGWLKTFWVEIKPFGLNYDLLVRTLAPPILGPDRFTWNMMTSCYLNKDVADRLVTVTDYVKHVHIKGFTESFSDTKDFVAMLNQARGRRAAARLMQ